MPPEDDKNAKGSGGQGSQSGSGVSAGQTSDSGAAGGAGAGAANGGEGEPKKTPDFITPDRLTAILDARQRKQEAYQKKMDATQGELSSKLDALMQRLEEGSKKTADDHGAGGSPKKQDEAGNKEMIALRKQIDELSKRAADSENRAKEETHLRRDTEFKNAVTAALAKAGCEQIEAAYRVIKEELTHSEDGRIFATVKHPDYGEEDVDLETYVTKHFAEEILPQVFRGKMRSGSAASGDSSAGGGSFRFTKEQIEDPAFYAKHREEIREALQKGQVKGVVRGSY